MEGVPEDKCALVSELVQVLEMVRQLEAHMAAAAGQAGHHQLQGGGGGCGGDQQQRCRALVTAMRAAIDRAVHMAMTASACCAAEGRRPAAGHGGHPESPPSGGDGSPRSAGSDQEFPRGRGNNAAGGSQCKKRKMLPRVSTQVRVRAVKDVSPLDDGLSWRKYGQKDILGAKYPRAYFRCTHRHTQSCHASKQVQRTDGDPLLFDVVYHGTHTCAQAQAQSQGAAAADTSDHQNHGQVQPADAERVLPPFSLVPSSSRAPGADDAGAATNSRFVFASSSPATPECLQVSSSYAVGGGVTSVAGVRNVPDVEVELVSSASSPIMGEMEFMFPLDTADFMENPNSYF
ncbi:hypothetical protein U9M48_018207 [Paspalum notatum var. saurae]|uniref:WRKY domain-containing protein n=1 Tax=Paspalum notatum var. saurae TaxID=547442 RepID=A0AAQ3T907_PASNO